MPIFVISVAMCSRPALPSSCASGPRNIRAPVARQNIARQCPRRAAADPAPQLQIGVRDHARLAMTPPPLIPGTPAWRLTLGFDVRSIIVLRATLAHRGMRRRATAHQARLAERAGYRSRDRGPRGAAKAVRSIVRQRQIPDFRMQRLHVDRRLHLGFRRRTKKPGGAFEELIAPLHDLVRLSGTRTCPAGNRWTSKSCANAIKVFSPLIAATATFAFYRRAGGFGAVVLPWSSPRSRQSCRRGAEKSLILGGQFSRAISVQGRCTFRYGHSKTPVRRPLGICLEADLCSFARRYAGNAMQEDRLGSPSPIGTANFGQRGCS
jgi:hypothetical protein